jgi:hypothetical protein
MTNVIAGMTLSLDGYVADREGSATRLYPDFDSLRAYMEEIAAETGCVLMGRRTFDLAGDRDTYADTYEFQVPTRSLLLTRRIAIPFTIRQGFCTTCRFLMAPFDYPVSPANGVTFETREDKQMRFMILIKANEASEAGEMPSEQHLTELGKYNEELVNAGIMLSAEGLQPSSQGVRIHFSGENRTVTDGPFVETKELLVGYWIWDVESMEQAIEWLKRFPNPMDLESEIEIRPFA